MNQQTNSKVTCLFSVPFQYRGSIFWLIVWTVLFFPMGMLLFIKNAYKLTPRGSQYIKYPGSWGWIYFWGIIFFPLAFLMLFFSGISIVQEENTTMPDDMDVVEKKHTSYSSNPISLNRPRYEDEQR